MNISEEGENLERLNAKTVGLAVSDYLDIRLYFFEESRRTTVAFFYFYRKNRRKYDTLNGEQIRKKAIKLLCIQKNKILTLYRELEFFFEDCKDSQLFNGTIIENLECSEITEKLNAIPYASKTGKSLLTLKKIGIVKDRIDLRSPYIFKS